MAKVSVLISIKPYYLYLIFIGEKRIEITKDYPKSKDWNREVEMYCSKDKKSFNRIPKKDREWMQKFLGKVACRFVCDRIDTYGFGDMAIPTPAFDGDPNCQEFGDGYFITNGELEYIGLTYKELCEYGKGKILYGLHISNFVIYDKPTKLGEFFVKGECEPEYNKCNNCSFFLSGISAAGLESDCIACYYGLKLLTMPPLCWCYVSKYKQIY